MTYSSYFTTGLNLRFANGIDTNTVVGAHLDKARVLFEYLFTTEDSRKQQNKTLFLFLEYNIRNNDFNVVNRFINDDSVKDLHLSLIKSAILMTENLDNPQISTDKIISIYNDRIS